MSVLRIMVFIGCLASPLLAAAHSAGKLDNHGCHKDRHKGGYHCHGGPLKGQNFESQNDMLRAFHAYERAEEAKRKRSPWEARP
jgi:hypothetical protein